MFSRGARLALLVGLTGCSNILGIDDLHLGNDGGTVGADGGHDAPSTQGVFAGVVSDSKGPLANAAIQFYRDTPYELLGMMPTDASGAFHFENIPSLPVDGYFAFKAGGFVDQFNHLLEPSSGDSALAITTMTLDERDQLAGSVGLVADPSAGIAILYVLDPAGSPVKGAMIKVFPDPTPGTVCYAAAAQLDCGGGAVTDDTGRVIIFNAPAINNLDVMCPQTGLEAIFPITANAIVVTAVRPQS